MKAVTSKVLPVKVAVAEAKFVRPIPSVVAAPIAEEEAT